MLAEGVQVSFGEEFAAAEVTAGTKVIVGGLDVIADGTEHFERFGGHFGADAISADHCKFHSMEFPSHLMDLSDSLAGSAIPDAP
ncbi:hypothetical protein GCM10027031_00760 [Corynebacterium atrinae]